MDDEKILQGIKAELDAFAKPLGGRVSVARDPFDVLELLTVGPAGFLLILHDAGDDRVDLGLDETMGLDDEDNVQEPVRMDIEVSVGYGLGLDAARDWRLIAGKGNRPGLPGRCRALRAMLLGLKFKDDEESLRRLRYEGRKAVVTPDGVPLAAYRMRFSLQVSVLAGDDVEVTDE